MTYTQQGTLILNDSQGRFCATGGSHPILRVDYGGGQIVGVYPVYSKNQSVIVHIPGPSQSGTFDLVIETPIRCEDGAPTQMLCMPNAVTYVGG